MPSIKKSLKEKGQGLVEYALILVLVSVATVASLSILGPAVGDVYSDIDEALSTLSFNSEITINNCRFRAHNNHFHWSCGTKGDLGFEKGWYACGSDESIDGDLKTEIESTCST